jgi:hypothetical protein
MGLFSLMSRKSPASSGGLGGGASLHKSDLNSRGRITPREMRRIWPKLIDRLGRRKAEMVKDHLNGSMDNENKLWGGRNVSDREVKDTMEILEKSRYNGMDKGDLDATQKILEEYQ